MDRFEKCFQQLTGNAPFDWQTRLYTDWFAKGQIPTSCGIPTGLGKTAVMAIWLIAKAEGAKLPRRLVYVVDRRAVVDQATGFAEQIQSEAGNALAMPDLPVSTLRGQFADNRQWLQDPSGLSIVVGTVDMIGSRVLFSGYGVSRRMRPYHAGLLGNDALLLLDEAHLCPPFEALLDTVVRDPQDELGPVGHARAMIPPLRLMTLTATGRNEAADGFLLRTQEVEQRRQPLAHQRYTARKDLAIVDLADAGKLIEEMTHRAWEIAQNHGPARIAIFCDRRVDAEKVKTQLDKWIKKQKSPAATELLVGGRRVRERQALQGWLKSHGFLGQAQSPPAITAFLVATSAGEVGVDLDAEHLVCDLVAWERMVQRLGRVNRKGGVDRRACVDVFAVPEKKTKGVDVEVYRACRRVLVELPISQYDPARHDASPAGIDELKARAQENLELATALDRAVTPVPLRPALTRPLVDAWSLTALDEHTGRPDVEPWLRGWADDDEPQATVAWRCYLPWLRGEQQPFARDVDQHFSAAPIHLEETLETATHRIRDTLAKRSLEFARIWGEDDTRQKSSASWRDQPGVIVLDRAGSYQESWRVGALADLAEIKSVEKNRRTASWHGRILVVAAELGGLSADGMLDSGAGPHRSSLDGDKDDKWDEAVRRRIGYLPVGPSDSAPDSRRWKLASTVALAAPEASDAADSPLLQVYVARGKAVARRGDQALAAKPQVLEEHHQWAEASAAEIADALGLSPRFKQLLLVAARHHDAGKHRVLWQISMNAPLVGGPFAKTAGGGDPRRLNGYRHEFGSLRDALDHDDLASLDDDARDMVLHLIAAHHGFARPTITPFDPDAPPAERIKLVREAAQRFARLQRQWGPWGLAWWESLLRAADVRASQRLDREGGE